MYFTKGRRTITEVRNPFGGNVISYIIMYPHLEN